MANSKRFANGGIVGEVANSKRFANGGVVGEVVNSKRFANGGIVGEVANSKRFANGGIVGEVANSKRFANGGIVSGISKRAANGFIGGNNYSGDMMPIAVNSGELILNRAQQGNLASQLSGVGMSAMKLSCKVNAKDMEFILNHHASDTSRGRYLTSKRNR